MQILQDNPEEYTLRMHACRTCFIMLARDMLSELQCLHRASQSRTPTYRTVL